MLHHETGLKPSQVLHAYLQFATPGTTNFKMQIFPKRTHSAILTTILSPPTLPSPVPAKGSLANVTRLGTGAVAGARVQRRTPCPGGASCTVPERQPRVTGRGGG